MLSGINFSTDKFGTHQYKTLDVYGQLAALQAVIIYILLQAQDYDTAERNGANSLLSTMMVCHAAYTYYFVLHYVWVLILRRKSSRL